MKKNDTILKMSLTLLIICVIMAFLLSFVNSITIDKIALNSEKALTESLAKAMPSANNFEPYDNASLEGFAKKVYIAKNGDSKIGYCVLANPVGYGGEIELLIGINADKKITGVEILSISETPGLGSNAKKPDFLNKFKDKKGNLTVAKTASGKEDEIVALSGATITSKAVTQGVNDALKTIEKGGY